jgi:diguanylate cyclase (GGDEF)-like protein
MKPEGGSGPGHPPGSEGAPREAASKGRVDARGLAESVTFNRYLYRRVQQLEHMLLAAPDLQSLLEVLLISLPRHFAFPVCELWLYDPDDQLRGLIPDREGFGDKLRLVQDVFDMQDLYDPEPDVAVIDATDPRMFELLKGERSVNAALLMPLLDAGRLVGSLHWGFDEMPLTGEDADGELIAHLGSIISICFQNAVSRQRLAQLSLLDPRTEIGNRRGFEAEIAREIARARRQRQPLTLMLLDIDQYDDLADFRGSRSIEGLVKRLAERIIADLRVTDQLSRLSNEGLAALLPAVNEVVGEDIAERVRRDLEEFPIDDGKGAVMHTTVSIGIATWEPMAYPAVDLRQLARQLESAAAQARDRAVAAGGNRVSVSRLKTLIF